VNGNAFVVSNAYLTLTLLGLQLVSTINQTFLSSRVRRLNGESLEQCHRRRAVARNEGG